MTNRAQVIKPYTLDMFTALPVGTLVTFTDNNAPSGAYNVTIDGIDKPININQSEFKKYFKYYNQQLLFS